MRTVLPLPARDSAAPGDAAYAGDDAYAPEEVPPVPETLPLHKLLDPSFRIQSKAFMLTYNSDTFAPPTWAAFRARVRHLAKHFKARAWAANLEESLQAAPGPTPRFHVHAYLMWTDGAGFCSRNTDDLLFQGVRPRVDACTVTSPKKFKGAACRGLWYVSIMKKGTLHADTNYHPWQRYVPRGSWLEDLWAAQKLSDHQFLALSPSYGPGHAGRRRDALDVLRDAREEAVAKHVASEQAALLASGQRKRMREFPEVTAFVDLFSGGPRFRRPLLAIIGPTNAGKSLLAADVLVKVGQVLALPEFVEVTVEASEHLDVGDFDVQQHAGILLDGVADALFLKRHREVLQGRPKVCKGGKSGTMMYAYSFSLCRRAVVATFDLSAANLDLFRTDHWLSDPRNVVQLRLEGPAWEGGLAPPPAASSAREMMATWSVNILAEHLAAAGLAGAASWLQRAGVSGEDFLAWAAPSELESDLKLLPFTAKKVLRWRDGFLGAP